MKLHLGGFLEKVYRFIKIFKISVYNEDPTQIPTEEEHLIHHSPCHIVFYKL